MEYYFGIGKRKSSVARVKVKPGSGKVAVNGKDYKDYFSSEHIDKFVLSPFDVTGLGKKNFDVDVKVQGGGPASQMEAVRHGITRALIISDPSLKHILRQAGFVTRDPRAKERKKPGLKRARRAPQWSKR